MFKCSKCDFNALYSQWGGVIKYKLGTNDFLTGHITTGWCYRCNEPRGIEKLPTIQECQSDIAKLQSKIQGLEKESVDIKSSFLGRALNRSRINDLQNKLNDAKQKFVETEKRLRWISKRISGARCLRCGSNITVRLDFQTSSDGQQIAQGFVHSCGGNLFIDGNDDDQILFSTRPVTVILDWEGNFLSDDRPNPKIPNVPLPSHVESDDEEILMFQEDYPDVYDFVKKVLAGNCDDETMDAIADEYGEEFLDIVLKVIADKATETDIEALREEFGDDIYPPVKIMVQQKKAEKNIADKPHKDKNAFRYKKGDLIGQKYEVYDVLGEGGFGIVYLAYSRELKRAVALKTLRDEYIADEKTRERFKREAQVWIDLDRHPYIVRAFFVTNEVAGRLLIVIEHIAADEPGMNTLEGYLRHRLPDLTQSLKWAIQFCHGMEYAYSRGVKAHRDIKPANIMIDQNKTIKITDFGLAGVLYERSASEQVVVTGKSGDDSVMHTVIGTSIGTPEYMPPEQFTDLSGCDAKSDIYSFGIVLYQMASGGRLPFSPDNPAYRWTALKHLHQEAPVPKLNSPLFSIIFRCLEKKPINRYSSFEELRKDLESLLIKETGEIVRMPESKELEGWELANKGSSLIVLSKFEEAVECFDRALLQAPTNEQLWLKKSLAFKCQRKPHDVILCVDRVLLINPQNGFAWGLKGDSLTFLNRYADAISCYDESLKIDPHDSNALQGKGSCLFSLKYYEAALECFKLGITIDPDNALTWFQKAGAEDSLKLYSDAMFSFRSFLEKADQGDYKRIQYAKQRLDSMK